MPDELGLAQTAGRARRSVETLKISISGVRGVVGESLTPDLLVRFATAFGTYMNGGRVVIGSDTRTSREMVRHAVTAGLISSGCAVIDIGIAPVPSVQMAVTRLRAAGGIALTASHNPAPWNALKFIRSGGLFLSPNAAEELVDIYHQGQYRRAATAELQPVRFDTESVARHLDVVCSQLAETGWPRSGVRVALDCCNGAASDFMPSFLERIGCQVFPINTEPNGLFPHPPEPVPENLGQLGETVRRYGADIGFAQDADADRLAVVDETGNPIGEEWTVTLAASSVLRRQLGPVVVNLSTTSRVEHVARQAGVPLIRTPVGEVNVAEAMQRSDAVIGGEGSGGVIWPAVHLGRDSFCAAALILSLIAERGMTVSALTHTYPTCTMLKRRVEIGTEQTYAAVRRVRAHYAGVPIDDRDGVRVDLSDGWIHVRASRTEPLMRITVESMHERRAQELMAETMAQIRGNTDVAESSN